MQPHSPGTSLGKRAEGERRTQEGAMQNNGKIPSLAVASLEQRKTALGMVWIAKAWIELVAPWGQAGTDIPRSTT